MGMSHDLETAIEEGVDLRARGNGAVRQAEERRDRRDSIRRCRRRARGWPIIPRRCWPNCGGTGAWKWRPRAATSALYHLGNNGLHADIYRRALAEPGRGGAARCRAASFPAGPTERGRVRRRVRLQLRRVESRPGAGTVARPRGVGGRRAATFAIRCCGGWRSGRGRWSCTIRRPRGRCANMRRTRAWSRFRICSRRRELPGDAGSPALSRSSWASRRNLPLRRLRLSARIEAADAAVLERSPRCTRELPQTRAADRRAVRFDRPGTRG